MLVSVIVPVHKPHEWLPQCLDSIECQEYDIQLIRVDDPRGEGPAIARNRGLKEAKGDYVMFVDSDDYLEPGSVRKMSEAMTWGTDLVVGSFRKFGNFESFVTHDSEMGPWEVAMYVMENLRNPRKYQMLSGCWAKLFRRELAGRFPNITTAEDMAFNFDYLTRCKGVKFIPDVVYHNRKREGSLTTTFDSSNRKGLFGFLEGLKHVKKFLAPYYSEAEINDALDNSKVYHSMLYFMRICDYEKRPMREVFNGLYA